MELKNLRWPDVHAIDRDIPVVIPVAAMEQHGHHMPLFTDSILLGELVRRVQAEMDDRILVAPLMWLGNSHHHLDFPGTLSAEPRVWLDLLDGIIENFLHHGFRRIVVLNGHGGNDVPGRQTTFEIRQRHRSRSDLLLLFATYWSLAPDAATRIDLVQPEMGHAGEWETSMMLWIDPALVGDFKSVADVPHGDPFNPAHRAWVMQDRSEPGHVGSAARASAEKGEQLLDLFARAVTDFLHRVIRWDGKSWDG
jgi:creatinine amidohydrolase